MASAGAEPPPHRHHALAGMLGLKARDLGRRLGLVVDGPYEADTAGRSVLFNPPQASLKAGAHRAMVSTTIGGPLQPPSPFGSTIT